MFVQNIIFWMFHTAWTTPYEKQVMCSCCNCFLGLVVEFLEKGKLELQCQIGKDHLSLPSQMIKQD